jgi:3-isopropylmalate/(R)-2-methylmalate dehydratase large subunit
MGMTLTQKIVAAKAGRDRVRAGEIVTAKLDFVLGNELSSVLAIKEFEKIPGAEIFDPSKVCIVSDHFTPNKDLATAAIAQKVRAFAKRHGVRYFEVGRGGIEHALIPDEGLALPGTMMIGGDSHTCTMGAFGCFATGVGSTDLAAAWALGEWWMRVPETILFRFEGELRPWVVAKDLILEAIRRMGVDGARYRSIELTGSVVDRLDMVGRLTMTNMAIEMGAKNGVCPPDAKTEAWVRARTDASYTLVRSDPDASYAAIVEIDCSSLEPLVAFPHLPSNGKPVSEAAKAGIRVDQVFIGSCTNGRIEDLRLAAHVLRGRKVSEDLRVIVIPASQRAYKAACAEGLAELFVEAGCVFSTPTCGPCFGGHMGVLGAGEVCLSTTNRNFVGRMGHRESQVFLANPAVAAATAVVGRIASPEELGIDPPDAAAVFAAGTISAPGGFG